MGRSEQVIDGLLLLARSGIVERRVSHVPNSELASVAVLRALAAADTDPEEVDFVIPGNDDAIRAIRLFASKMAEACIEGGQRRKDQKQTAAEGKDEPVVEAAKPKAAPAKVEEAPAAPAAEEAAPAAE